MTIAPPLLSANLTVDYMRKPGALRGISLQINRGEILGLVGQSGSGKSTLLLSLLNLLPLKGGIVRGEVLFNGEDLLRRSERELRAIRGRQIGIVLQSPATSLNPVLTIGSQLREAWKAHATGKPGDCLGSIRSAMDNVALPSDDDFLRRRPSQLSIGQGQRVCIAMAILHRPVLLLADEVTSALDAITQSEILGLFARLNRDLEMAILYISHDLLSVANFCQRVVILHEGQIVECGIPAEIFTGAQHEYTRRLVAALPKSPFETCKGTSDSRDRELAGVQYPSS